MSGVRLLVPVSSITVYECRGGEGKYSSRSGLPVLLLILSTSGMRLESDHHHADEGDVELPYIPDKVHLIKRGCVLPFEARRSSGEIHRRDTQHGSCINRFRRMCGTNNWNRTSILISQIHASTLPTRPRA